MTADTSIAERFRDVVAAAPDALALTSARARFTYAELDRWSDTIAAEIAADPQRDRPLAILADDQLELVATVIGAIKAGRFFVVIDATEPAERIDTILRLSGATAMSGSADRTVGDLRSITPHELVQLIFTSGTTGTPKAIAQKHRGLVERLVSQSALTGRAAGERVSYTALPGFARATYEILGSLLNGATLCAFDARAESLDALGDFIRRERVSILTLTPALFRRFMQTAPADLDLSGVKKLRIGADVVTVADVEAYKTRFPRGCTLERGFNSTETGLVTHMRIDHDTPIPGPLVPIGRPLSSVVVRIVDEEGRDVADGDVGELIVRGPNVAAGYWNGEPFPADGFHTGDLVKRDRDGLHYFIGRKDARLKIHGRRIDPLEIESALLAHTGIREAVVVGKPDAHGETRLVAYIVSAVPRTARDVRAALRGKLPPFLIPSRIHALDAIPMTAAGKVDRAGLLQRVDANEPRDDDATSALERTLVEIWSRVIGTPVRTHDNFFDDLGGESVVAAHLVSEVQRLLGRAMPLSLLLELDTVAKMADYLRTRAETDIGRTAILVRPGGARPPLFCVSGKGGSVMIFRELAALLDPDRPFYGLTHHGFAAAAFPKTFAAMAACYADAIRAVQPEGPYHLAGYSAGGLIAFDLARHLARAGAEVAFVGIIDAAAAPMRTPMRTSTWKHYLKHASLLRQQPMSHAPRYARALAKRAAGLLRRPAPSELHEMNRVYDAIERRDALQPYAGRVTLFVATHGRGYDGPPDLGWRPLCGELDVIPVPGEHHTVIREDVATLAEAMRNALALSRGPHAAASVADRSV